MVALMATFDVLPQRLIPDIGNHKTQKMHKRLIRQVTWSSKGSEEPLIYVSCGTGKASLSRAAILREISAASARFEDQAHTVQYQSLRDYTKNNRKATKWVNSTCNLILLVYIATITHDSERCNIECRETSWHGNLGYRVAFRKPRT